MRGGTIGGTIGGIIGGIIDCYLFNLNSTKHHKHMISSGF